MFCYQCVQTVEGRGCTKVGVCGKNEDIASLQDTLLFGIKGIAAYGFHAKELGATDPEVDAFMYEALFSTLTNVDFDPHRFIKLILKAGEMNIKVLELLDKAHTGRFGDPEPTEVSTGTVDGHGIIVTGHDLLDLYELLKQTQGKGVNIYTHSEMLPAHGYPELKRFKHLVGNWGGVWHKQKREFDDFSGAILATTNCVLIPKDSYKDRLFTCGIAGIQGSIHIEGRDFSPLIDKALSLPPLPQKEGIRLVTGFHHKNVLALAGKIIALVKGGKIRHFFLIGGCDAPGDKGDYYREFAKAVPNDCVILTLACGKYRINDIGFGSIDGIPRLIDLGQCNNAYSAVQIASALAGAFKTDLNGLPLSLIVSWLEQKAVAILLSLLHLGIRGIRIGPRPPAFISDGVFKILQDTFDLKLIGDPKEDLKAILG
ncbi:MAG: hydroxylamine reductase [Nitrospinae bacterium]|nr:hydroxylamine reductase [Nitrospinota bacterium]